MRGAWLESDMFFLKLNQGRPRSKRRQLQTFNRIAGLTHLIQATTLMLVVLMMLGGLIELSTIVFIFTLNFIMNLMGLMMEKYNQLSQETNWLAFNIGTLAGIVPWIMGGLYFWVSTSNIADSIPVYAQFGFLLTFLFFNSFAINMWLQYKRVGKWKDYVYGEKAYITLSLVSKSALGWIIVLGTMGV